MEQYATNRKIILHNAIIIKLTKFLLLEDSFTELNIKIDAITYRLL